MDFSAQRISLISYKFFYLNTEKMNLLVVGTLAVRLYKADRSKIFLENKTIEVYMQGSLSACL